MDATNAVAEAQAWLDAWRGGAPRVVRAELEKAIKKGHRRTR